MGEDREQCMRLETPFASFFMGGFECSTHRRANGEQLDLLSATRHDTLAARDYGQLAQLGIRAVRDGLRWHLIEQQPGRYDWSSLLPMVRAAQAAGTQVIWDLCHYGWPTDLDIWSPHFVHRFARFARAAARVIASESGPAPWFCTVNEISFWAWAGGQLGHMGPCGVARGAELKRQLVRAALAARAEILTAVPRARFIQAEPLIHVVGATPVDAAAAEARRTSQFEAFDMLCGRLAPELGGSPEALDILGLNFYPQNQWVLEGGALPLGCHNFRPLAEMLGEVYARHAKPLFLAETGAEGSARVAWLHYVCDEVRTARQAGVPVLGICLYPVTDYPGWENNRPCEVGLLGMPDQRGRRPLHVPLAGEMRRQQGLLETARAETLEGSAWSRARG